MPIFQFDSLEAIPDALRSYAKTDGDKVQINLVPQDKLDEFRDKNISLVKEVETLKDRVSTLEPVFGEQDPTAFANELVELRAVAQRVKDGQLTDSRKIEEEVTRRTEDMKKGLEDQIRTAQKEGSNWKTKAGELETRYKSSLVSSTIRDAANDPDTGVLPQAIPDILSRAASVWRAHDDGKVLAYQGELQLYGADGGSPLTPKEWLAKLKDDAPHFFKGTAGGGAGGSDNTPRNQFNKSATEMKALSAKDRLALANGDKPARL